MNAAIPVEEAYKILTDEKQNGHLVLLDAKAAFDKVIHSHLFRRMYHAGNQDKTWTVIQRLHHNAESCIKWTGSTSDCFKVGMGVQTIYQPTIRPFARCRYRTENRKHQR